MGDRRVRRIAEVDYGLGQSLDIYEPEGTHGSAAVLLWHGSGDNEREVLEPLAGQVAATGITVFVPDWSRRDGGGGRHHLTASLAFVRDHVEAIGVNRVALAGWSLGASAGLGAVRVCTALEGWGPGAFIGISGGYDQSPFDECITSPFTHRPSIRLLLIHGSSDEVVPVGCSRRTFERLRAAGWDVVLREVDTDHAGTIGTIYDPYLGHCVPTAVPDRQELLKTIAAWMAELILTGDG
jgi:predicted esterase